MSEKGSAIDLSQYIIRVYTPEYRYRFSLKPNQRYIDLLQLVTVKPYRFKKKQGLRLVVLRFLPKMGGSSM